MMNLTSAIAELNMKRRKEDFQSPTYKNICNI